MRTAELATLLDYNTWANGRVLDAAARLLPAQFVAAADPPATSLRHTLVHILRGEQLWRSQLQPGAPAEPLRPEDAADVATLRASWQAEVSALRAYLARLDEAALDRPITVPRRGAERTGPFVVVPWQLLLQQQLHSAQHRSEAATLLTAWGHSPGNLDFLYFLAGG